jgi:hypothetical protein
MKIEFILIAMSVIMILFFIYILVREKDSNRKMRTLAKSVGEVSRQLYESEMRLNEKIKQIESLKVGLSEADIETLVSVGLSERLLVVDQSTHFLKEQIEAFSEEFAGRIVRIENNLKESSISRANVGGADDQRILQMFKDGFTVEDIAKDLRISTPEVEFALKLADLR